MSVYVRGEYIKTNTGSEGCRSAVFREGFNKDQQGAYGIIAGQKRGQNAAEAVKEISSENLSCLIEAGTDIQHGIFQDAYHKRQHME